MAFSCWPRGPSPRALKRARYTIEVGLKHEGCRGRVDPWRRGRLLSFLHSVVPLSGQIHGLNNSICTVELQPTASMQPERFTSLGTSSSARDSKPGPASRSDGRKSNEAYQRLRDTPFPPPAARTNLPKLNYQSRTKKSESRSRTARLRPTP
ncbi:hypothetical protein VTK56DRAFT_5613 [Thermocarpiscus australiensis]